MRKFRSKDGVVRDIRTGEATAYLNRKGEITCGACHQEACGVHYECRVLAGRISLEEDEQPRQES